jgi:hypothetical protein
LLPPQGRPRLIPGPLAGHAIIFQPFRLAPNGFLFSGIRSW